MFKCNYCGRIFKKSFEECPGCGAASFKKIMEIDNLVIDKPPEGGYKLDLSNFNKQQLIYFFCILIGIMIILVTLAPAFQAPNIVDAITIFLSDSLLFTIIGIILISVMLYLNKGIKQKVKKIEKLKYKGILIKNMKFDKIQQGNNPFTKKPIYAIRVVYKNANGIEMPLISENKYNKNITKKNKTVDLLIDLDDFNNYYIDFEIY